MEGNFTLTGTAIFAAVLSVEMILALIANGIVLLITITQRKSWKQSSTIFFTSLILAHLVMTLLYVPFFIIAFAAGGWIFGSTDEEKRGTCYFAAFVFWFTSLVISMTLAAISFDRFLFIVKPHLHKRFMRPWVALTLTIALWILAAFLSSFQFYALNRQYSLDYCTPVSNETGLKIYFLLLSAITVGIISVTSIWTFCYTCSYINNQSVTAGESVYASRKKKLIGIFGSMLIVYGICYTPGVLNFALQLLTDVTIEYTVAGTVCFVFITVAGPIVQSYFRPEIKKVFISRCPPLLSACLCCSHISTVS